MDIIVALLEVMLLFRDFAEKPKAAPRALPDRWTPPSTEEVARAVGWPNPALADPLWDRELDG